ncbi:DNA-binding transcriptional LysR family regulator [Povalibacter uvarum]|uniref:DNA-binding transcriptional LysR family regulator n=1 Tax=Povalibacter uvarum TaxID=732238 RepID=A0A841HIX4_9GAMM|nr:LysR family transcriptional regulator [Povalibacter uvarum]MBB6092178.1 DNA-binding transcriptional LysR family regulator [Povalibacter uvarum]
MELRHLRYFITVAEEGHITRAAERLGMQQPPLSQQIRALERELDVQLFRRKPRGVELTDAGTAFLERARSILEEVDRAFATARRTARGEQGRVVVGFTGSAPFHPFVPRVIRAFREMYPLVSLVLEESGSSELVQGLHNEDIDAAFIRSPVADVVGLVVKPLLEEDMLVALPAGHALARETEDRALPLSALANEIFILYKRPGGPGLYDTIITACRGAGFSPRVGQEAPRIISTLNLVAAGLGVSVVPASLRRLQMDGVVYRRLSGSAELKAPLILACRPGENSAAVQRFLDLVQRPAESVASDN